MMQPSKLRCFGLCLALGLGAGLSACAYDLTTEGNALPGGESGAAPGGTCIPRQAIFCDCSTDTPGVQTCSEEGAWGACDCTAPVGPGGDLGPITWEVTCETDRYWNDYEDNGKPKSEDTMIPGGNCIGCHADWREGPNLTVAGTVFYGLHDDDDCYGAPDVTVEITGADDRVHRLRTNRTGNFLAERDDLSIALPYTARVITEDGERVMLTEQTDLDCNSCHTIAGAEEAPGRIIVPESAVE